MDKKPPYEYIIVPRPLFDFQLAFERDQRLKSDANEDDHGDDDETDPENLVFKRYEKAYESTSPGELASNHPEHKWVMYRNAYMGYVDMQQKGEYANPDNMDMYIYNDWYSYGLLELIDNQVRYSVS